MIENIELKKKAPLATNGKTHASPEKTSIGQNVWARPDFAHDDLAIPAFLRRR
jgi:hypothetical protein